MPKLQNIYWRLFFSAMTLSELFSLCIESLLIAILADSAQAQLVTIGHSGPLGSTFPLLFQ